MPDNIYKHVHLTGSSTISSDDAIRTALKRANKTIRAMRWFEVVRRVVISKTERSRTGR